MTLLKYKEKPEEYAKAVALWILVGNEFNLFTNGKDELRSYIVECVSGCGQMTTIRERLQNGVYCISWFHFNVKIQKNRILFVPKNPNRAITPLRYGGHFVKQIEICQPKF